MNATTYRLLLTTFAGAGALALSTAVAEPAASVRHRLINTTDAEVVDPGTIQLSLGLDYTTDNGRKGYTNRWGIARNRPKARVYDWNLTARTGLMEDLDAFMTTGWADMRDRSEPYGDDAGRGMDDLTVGVKYVLWRCSEAMSLAYQPALTIPVGRAPHSGQLSPGQSHWSVEQTLALTREWEAVSGSVSASHAIPFGEGRHHYAQPFLNETRKTRGTSGLDAGLVYTEFPVQPLVELNYKHEWVSHGNDSDLIATTVGARAELGCLGHLLAGVQYPLAGRNSYRGTTFTLGLVTQF
jgi:hypothetical protein